jgi:chemotaxis protein histidine kinase CheA
MIRCIVLCAIVGFAVSCKKDPGTTPPTVTAPGTAAPAAGSTTLPKTADKLDPAKVAKEAQDKIEAAATEAKAKVEAEAKAATEAAAAKAKEAAAKVEDAAAKVEDTAKASVETAKETVDAAAKDLPDLAKVAEGDVSVETLKGAVGSLSAEKLESVGGTLADALGKQKGILASLKDEIGKLGLGDVTKLADLTKSLESSSGLVKVLTEKLQVVVTALKDKGVDVSKFTALLTGA